MAKLKKNQSKSNSVIGKSIRKSKDTKKELSVKLHRMSPKEIAIYTTSDQIIVKSMNIGIKNGLLSIGNKQINSPSNVFDIELKINSSEIAVESDSSEANKLEAEKSKTVMRTNVQTLNSIIGIEWKRCKGEFGHNKIEIGDIVLAKMSGYSPWPSRIEDFSKNRKRINVYFFGTNNRGSVNATEVVAFEHCFNLIRYLSFRKFSEFHKSVIEVETLLGIESHLSLLKECQAIQ